MVQAERRFRKAALENLRAEIEEAEGNEVFALGYLDDKGFVKKATIAARGHKGAVLALRDGKADVLIHNHPSGFLTPSDNDLIIASEAAEDGTGSWIVNNEVTEVYVVAEALKAREKTLLDGEALCAAMEADIARKLPVYERRDAQLGLLKLIVRGFNEDSVVAAEAGTGVGKSFAYLLPALSFALGNDERIVISTATINLQQQLYEKDIPLVSSILKKEVKCVLVKGRANYLCLRRLHDALSEPSVDPNESRQTEAIADWARSTPSGSRSDLSFLPDEAVWSRVCSEGDLCMGMRCPHREDCFFMALRRETAAARILVVNHHLLFADLAARHAGAGWEATVVLPPYGRIILDEAHTVEAAATSFFSREWSRFAVYRLIGRLYRKRRGADPHIGAASGLLLQAPGFPRLDDAVECLERLRRAADNLDETALGICGEEAAYRFTRARRFQLETHLFPRLKIFREEIMSLIRIIEKYLESYLENSKDEEANPAIWELQALVRRLDALSATAENALEYLTREEDVVWMERRKGSADRSWVRFVITPVDVAPSLSEALFKPHKTVICVSATLTIAGNFSWWMSRAGLVAAQSAAQESAAGRAILTGMFPSPFPYATSVLLCSPADSPSPEQDGFPEFVDRAVRELVEISGGGALVLFTSYESLKSAYSASRGILESQGIRCLKQGDDDRARLLGAFLKDESSALFATDSFWEGVDAPGDTLRLVIICRLPFKAPRDPVFEARCEAIAARGGVPFMELSLPEAIMKFKQGFGRLMRRSSDRGVVAVLDSRVLHKQYGGLFLRSLPQTRTLFGEFSAILREAESFLFDK